MSPIMCETSTPEQTNRRTWLKTLHSCNLHMGTEKISVNLWCFGIKTLIPLCKSFLLEGWGKLHLIFLLFWHALTLFHKRINTVEVIWQYKSTKFWRNLKTQLLYWRFLYSYFRWFFSSFYFSNSMAIILVSDNQPAWLDLLDSAKNSLHENTLLSLVIQ